MAVVIPNWNGAAMLPDCLESVLGQKGAVAEPIVVDNGSEDESVDLLRRDYPGVALIALGENTGFAHAVNVGVAAADTDLVAVMNNDATADPLWLSRMADVMNSHPKAGACASVVLQRRESEGRPLIDSAGHDYSTWGLGEPRMRGCKFEASSGAPQKVFGVSGAACLFRKDAFLAVGGFDRTYFAYYEDIDLSFRLWHFGYEIWLAPDAFVWHEIAATSGGSSSPWARRLIVRNSLRAFLENFPTRFLIRYSPLVFIAQSLWLSQAVATGLVRPQIAALIDVVSMRDRIRKKRRDVLGRSLLSEDEFRRLLRSGVPRAIGRRIRAAQSMQRARALFSSGGTSRIMRDGSTE